MKDWAKAMLGTGVIVGVIVVAAVYLAPSNTFIESVTQQDSSGATVIGGCLLPSAPSITATFVDKYGGGTPTDAVPAMYRKQGQVGWTSFSNGGTITADPNQQIEFYIGTNTSATQTTDVGYGPHFTMTVPCESYPLFINPDTGKTPEVIDHTTNSSVALRVTDIEDNTVIALGAPIDIDNGDVFSLPTFLQGGYQAAYGNPFTTDPYNVIVYSFNSTQYTTIKATDLNGNAYTETNTPARHVAAAGYITKAYKIPVLESNKELNFYTLIDASGSGKKPNGNQSNITIEVYDSTWFLNENTVPSTVTVGVEDENSADIGAVGPVIGLIRVELEIGDGA